MSITAPSRLATSDVCLEYEYADWQVMTEDALREPAAVGLRQMEITGDAIDQLDDLMARPSRLTITPRRIPLA